MPDETEFVANSESLNLTKEQLSVLLNKLLESSKETLRIVLETLKNDGKEALDRGKQFTRAANELTLDLIARKITHAEYKDAMENIAMAMDAYLISQGYEKSRKYLTIVVDMLKNMIGSVISTLL